MILSTPYLMLLASFLLIAAMQLTLPLTQRTQRFAMWLVNLGLIGFLGLRGFVQTDWVSYYALFNDIPTLGSCRDLFSYDMEIGFLFFTSFCKTIYPGFHVYILFNVLIDLFLLKLVFERYLPKRYYALFIVLFLAYFGLVQELNLLRNSKSLLLFLLSLKYLSERDAKFYFLLNYIGLLFHWSSIVFFPLYFILHKRVSKRTYMILFSISLLFFFFYPSFIKDVVAAFGYLMGGNVEERMTIYLETQIYARGRGLSYGDIERIVMGVIVGFYFSRLQDEDKANTIFVNAFSFFLFSSLLGSGMDIILTRFSSLFAFSIWFIIPNIIKIEKQLGAAILVVYISMISMMRVYKQTNADVFFKYDNVVFGEMQPYEERLEVYKEHMTLEDEAVKADKK